MTVRIQNGEIQLSPQDRGLLKLHKWYISTDGYVRNHKGETLHSFIRKAERPLVVDHTNRRRDDNMRRNLKVVTRYENMKNSDYWFNKHFNHNAFMED
jgi:hypothetical protein